MVAAMAAGSPLSKNRPPLVPSSSHKGNAAPLPRPTTKNPTSSAPNHRSPSPRPATPSTERTTARSLSVSFQGEPFFLPTTKPKPTTPKPTPDRRKPTTPAKKPNLSDDPRRQTQTQNQNLLTRSLDFSSELKEPVLAAVRLLRQSVVFDTSTRKMTAPFNAGSGAVAGAGEMSSSSSSSDSDSLSSGSNSGRARSRGVSVPARYLQEGSIRLRPSPDSKKLLISAGSASSPLSKAATGASPSGGAPSPWRGGSGALGSASPVGKLGNAASIVGFAAEAKRARKGESRIEEAHLLRMLYNHYLQWRFINARACESMSAEKMAAEKDLYRALIRTSELQDSVASKRIKIQLLAQNSKLASILEGQMAYLEEWSAVDKEHLRSLVGAIEALKASTLRLPVVGAVKADVREVKDAIHSAVDVIEAMGTSICTLLEKVEGTDSMVSELAKVAAQERTLLEQSKNLLSMVTDMHVTQCSLQGQIVQLNRKQHLMQI